MQMGLWAAWAPLSFEDALIQVVSAGGDTDTNGAVAGAVLGARYGATAIPARWLAGVPELATIGELGHALYDLGATPTAGIYQDDANPAEDEKERSQPAERYCAREPGVLTAEIEVVSDSDRKQGRLSTSRRAGPRAIPIVRCTNGRSDIMMTVTEQAQCLYTGPTSSAATVAEAVTSD